MRPFLLALAILLSAACRPHAAPAPALRDWLAAGYAERRLDVAAAVDFYGRALEADPGNPTVQGRLLRMRIAEGNESASLELARRMDAAPQSAGAAPFDRTLGVLRLMADAARRQDWAEAAGRLQLPVAQTLPASVRLLALAWIRWAAGDDAGAAEALAEARNHRGAARRAALHHALLLHAAGRREEAAAAFERLRTAGAGRRGVLAEAAFRTASGHAEEALRLLRRYRELGGPLYAAEPDALEPLALTAPEGIAEVLYGVAAELQPRGLPAAPIYARLAAMLNPDHHAAFILIGDAFVDRGRSGEGLAAYEKVPAGSLWHPAAQRRRASAYALQDRFGEAEALLKAEGFARPRDPFPLGELGHLLRREQRFEDAAAAYDRAIARIDGPPEHRHWRLYYGRGVALERSRRWALAEKDLLAALNIVPDQAFVLNYLGYSWIDRGENYARAEEMLVRAVDLRPRDGHIADSLGWVYFLTGRYPQAVAELERAAALAPLEPVVNEHLGDAYWKVGRRTEAAFQWRRALDFGPEPERVEALRQRLVCGLDCE